MDASNLPASPDRIRAALERIARDYPAASVAAQLSDVERIAFHLSLIATLPAGARIADVGGGLGLFPPGVAALGYHSILVDDFRDLGNIEIAQDVFTRVHQKAGVEIVSRDVVSDGVDFPRDSLDAVTTFDSIEHWHHSPKKALHQLMAALKPGGKMIICVPNAVNLRKRVTVPLGINNWSAMKEWYEPEIFRSHVREPSVSDLHYIARDLGLSNVEILGRNWLGYGEKTGLKRAAISVIDTALRPFPTLCSDIYLIGTKPGR